MPLVVTKESLSEDLNNDDVSYSPYIKSRVQVWKRQAWLVWLLVTSRTFSQSMGSYFHQTGISFLLTARGCRELGTLCIRPLWDPALTQWSPVGASGRFCCELTPSLLRSPYGYESDCHMSALCWRNQPPRRNKAGNL